MSIRPALPVPTWLSELQDTAPEILEQYQALHINPPRDYRSTDEVRKDPFRPDRPNPKVTWHSLGRQMVPQSIKPEQVFMSDRDPTSSDTPTQSNYWYNNTTGELWGYQV